MDALEIGRTARPPRFPNPKGLWRVSHDAHPSDSRVGVMAPTLCVLVPSRGRPDSAADLVVTWMETQTRARLRFLVDDDDPTLSGYQGLTDVQFVDVVIGPRKRIGPTLNVAAVRAAGVYDAVGFCGDDHRPRTAGWDELMLAALIPGPGIVYGDDLFQGPNLPTAVVMSSSIINTLGRMVPPGLLHLHLDTAWRDLGNRAGILRYLPDVIIEHMHPQAGKALWDPGYEDVNSAAMWEHDDAAYRAYVDNGGLDADVAKVRALR